MDKTQIDELVEENIKLAHFVAHRFCRRYDLRGEYEDIFQEAMVHLWRAVQTWDPERSTLANYYVRIAELKLYRNHMTRQRKLFHRTFVSLDRIQEVNRNFDIPDVDTYPSRLREEIDALEPKYREAFELCAIQGMSTRKAAQKAGCSQPTMSRRLIAAERILRKKLLSEE